MNFSTDENGRLPWQMQMQMRFGEGFLRNYAPRLINDPEVAIVELVSNCSDAGADRVNITWPTALGGDIIIEDNGQGISFDEFPIIWRSLSYSRADQGKEVFFPSGNRQGPRKIFGRNGKGRLSLFCFDDVYTVETVKKGELCRFKVTRLYNHGTSLFDLELETREAVSADQHGTKLSCKATFRTITINRLIDLIGSKFISDPSFEIYVNHEQISLTDLEHIADKNILQTPYGAVPVYMFDSQKRGRTTQQHGVAWWVHNKSVGKQGWRGPNGTSLLDARTSEAGRYSFVVIADLLVDQVEDDWTGFIESQKTEEVLDFVNSHLQMRLNYLFSQKRDDRRLDALKYNRERLKSLPRSARRRVSQFVDDLQIEIPTIATNHLNAAVGVFANLEQTRTGYALLEQLARLTPNDLDKLHDILDKWSIQDAQIVLEELERRLKLIEKLDDIIGQDFDELHVIHPLIEKGLWLFGPEYESIEYRSNKTLAHG